MNRPALRLLGVSLSLCLLAASRGRADTPPVIACPWYSPTGGDDFASRGFFVPGYTARGTTLKQVTLYLSFPSTGSYQLSLTASLSTFDGTVLGTATTSPSVTSTGFQAVVFDFGTVTVPDVANTTVTFKGAVISKPQGVTGNVLMQTTTDPACPAYETTGTDAPLSTYRRGGIAMLITGDVPSSLNHTVIVPATASIHGANGTFFHTDLWIANFGPAMTVTATYRCFAGQSCGTGTATISLDASKAKTFSDIVGTLFNAPETAGAIEFKYAGTSSNNQLKVLTRTYSPSLPNPTTGASLNGLLFINATGGATYLGLGNNGGDRSAGFRSNVGVFNPWGFPTTVTFKLSNPDGTPIGQAVTQSWGNLEARQISDIFGAAGAESVVTTDAVLQVTSTLPVFPYVTVIDNVTGDSVIEE